jgi:2-polyprenyl-6-hydroxyphenyl methylase / 3-demethylubiquinone-9 3-methyltransferase
MNIPSKEKKPSMKIDDIRPERMLADKLVAMQHDIDWLKARVGEFVHVPCPACNCENSVLLYEKSSLKYRRCSECATQYASPRPDAKMIGEFLKQSKNYAFFVTHIFPASAEVRRKQIFVPRVDRVEQAAKDMGIKGGTLLEVGAGFGFFCEEMGKRSSFEHVIALEPGPDMANACREKGIETIESIFETAVIEKEIDIITCFEVIEHLFCPADFVSWAASILNPGGYLYLTCPNIAGFETDIMKQKSGTIDHGHINLFNPDSLGKLVERHGFEVVEFETPGKLDVDAVRLAFEKGIVTSEELGDFVTRIVSADADTQNAFQNFLQDQQMSSHMMMMARKI